MIERLQNQVDEIELWDVELEDMPNLEASDIPGVYFNEFREYVDEEGKVLSPSEVDAIRHKDDYGDDYYREKRCHHLMTPLFENFAVYLFWQIL